jgi:hypothetical protein
MPTVEIVSIDSDIYIDQQDYKVAILVDKKLKSHRGLFFDFLIKQNGTMIHVGNPDFKNDKGGGFFAGAIIDWGLETNDLEIPRVDPNDSTDNWGANQSFKYRFSEECKSDVDRLIKTAITESKIKKVYFLTDYQFGPEKPSHEIIYTLKDLWDRHDNEGLEWNKLYEIYSV